MVSPVANNGIHNKSTLTGVCDLWECISAFYGVQIAMETTFSTQIWPLYCDLLYTVYHTDGDLPEIVLQHSRLMTAADTTITAAGLLSDLGQIEVTMSRSVAKYATSNSPAHLLLLDDDPDSYFKMRAWWTSQGRSNHV